MKGDNMNLNEFRHVLKNSCEDIVKEINSIMKKAPVPSKCFPSEKYEFSWKPLKDELRKYNFVYSQDDKQFYEINTHKEKPQMEMNKNDKLTKIFDNAKNKENEDDKVVVSVRMSKNNSERIDNIVKNSKYTKSQFLNEIIEAVLDEYEDKM